MDNSYSQSWRQIYFNDLYLKSVSDEHNAGLKQELSVKNNLSFLNIGLQLVLSFAILISSAFILSWLYKKLDYEKKDYNDIPAYYLDTDQSFLKEFLDNGYIGMNKNKI